MSNIKNFRLMVSAVKPEQINRIEAGAALHKRHSNIEFKVLKFKDAELEIQVKQGKHLSKNYASSEVLVQRTIQLFKPVVAEHIQITVVPIPFQENPISGIDPGWLRKKMLENSIKVKDIVEDTGLDITNVSAWLNDKRPMSHIVKSLFYYYFLSKFGKINDAFNEKATYK